MRKKYRQWQTNSNSTDRWRGWCRRFNLMHISWTSIKCGDAAGCLFRNAHGCFFSFLFFPLSDLSGFSVFFSGPLRELRLWISIDPVRHRHSGTFRVALSAQLIRGISLLYIREAFVQQRKSYGIQGRLLSRLLKKAFICHVIVQFTFSIHIQAFSRLNLERLTISK